ncbi:flagellar assembly protein FliX [Nitrospirillum sp. BR 11752]|uniref:flagellar assembly protein FliX n=1 Tax=Nitrospirillum sp. BR 11752 TaxID=3104293 RepID=UPI002EBF8543|nr:flagellar assembly protein FliX [Nitrospirillum sp. BR 11752]
MKIEGPGSSLPTSQTRKTQRAGGDSFRTHVSESDGDESAKSVTGAQTAMAITPLLALQEVDDALNAKRKARQRAETLLDKLEELRLGLLAGTFPRERLQELVRMVQSRRDTVSDPRLQEVLDEIDLRAQVELAKFESAQR